jgi:hypothetical protein
MKKYINYVENFQRNNLDEVKRWINSNLQNHLTSNQEVQDEIEHILDYLCSNKSPKRLMKMSYLEANNNAQKWLKTLIKTNNKTIETPDDIQVILSLTDGFHWVKLISENSFKNEGARMKHCVGGGNYINKDIYSLRDKNNKPHCTIEKDKQIKGKGNGSIAPKYIGHVVEFLEYLGMTVSDNEMKNLGYFNCSEFEKDLHQDSLKLKFKNYLPISSKIKDLENNVFFDLNFINILGLIDNYGKITVDLNMLDYGINRLIKKINDKNASSGNYVQNASSGDHAQNASSGNYARNASSGNYVQNASSGYNVQNASSGDNARNASSGDHVQNASSGNYVQNASSGDHAQNASSGYNAQWNITGKNNVVASIGFKDKVMACVGTWVTLAEYAESIEGTFECINVVSKIIDGEILKDGVYYSLINGEFTEVN